MSIAETIESIKDALGESEPGPCSQIAACVEVLGEDQSRSILAQVREIEDSGGMMVPDGSRRRTPGGVFFLLARQKLPPEEKKRIFQPPPKPKPAQGTNGGSALARAARVRTVEVEGLPKPTAYLARFERRAPVPPSPVELVPLRRPVAAPADQRQDTSSSARALGYGGAPLASRAPVTPAGQPAPRAVDVSPSIAREVRAAADRARLRATIVKLLEPLDLAARRHLLLDLLGEIEAEAPAPESERVPESSPPASEPAPDSERLEAELKQRILATVGSRLNIPVKHLAETVFGKDTPDNRRKLKTISPESDDSADERRPRSSRPKASSSPFTKASSSPAAAPKAVASPESSLDEKIVAFVSNHPGCGGRELADGLDVSLVQLRRPLERLLSDGTLTKTGKTRITKYYRASGR